ncbi:hypothetical protein [Pedosphaera parvula]|uniref:Uncharacterized protein n=1 Tax=Pedosphaera parvula (strain Ellin514) TaxID=320771 RepID=B9XSL0_PEDPL|nr:hypothetical protein [Pedosphaera parvula]EEF57170.1 hypothetical protein Cflav_PD0136 [Pedosphaera parvula Ellin514]
MRPAFTSTRQAMMFGLLLLLLLLLPVMMCKSWLPPRQEIYSSLPWGVGAFPYLREQIFDEKEDMDLVFMGSSRIWWGIDTPQVQKALSEKLGRKAVVRTLAWDSPGLDPMYFIMRDLLEHRKVRVIVFSDCSMGGGNTAHPRAHAWFRWADNAGDLTGLSSRSKISFYCSTVLGMPRNLLGLLRTNLPPVQSDEISWTGFEHIPNPSFRMGSLALRMRLDKPFTDYTPHTSASPSDVCIYSEATKPEFRFLENAISPMQAVFVSKMGALAREHNVKLVYVHLPESTEMKSTLIQEPAFWPGLVGSNLTMMGIAPAKLFGGLADEDILKLFFNSEHFNQNGQIYFTSVITPRLVQVYEDQTKP